MGNKGRKQIKVARKDGKGQQGQVVRIPLSDIDMNSEIPTATAKRRLSEEEEDDNHMQIYGVMAKRCKRKQECDSIPESEVIKASLNWSPKFT